MFVCEKIRAICQQMPGYVQFVGSHPSARSRDFFDIFLVTDAFRIVPGSTEFRSLLSSTFEAKRVPLQLISQISETYAFHSGDFVSVLQMVKPDQHIHDFDFYFNYVLDFCSHLHSFWNE